MPMYLNGHRPSEYPADAKKVVWRRGSIVNTTCGFLEIYEPCIFVFDCWQSNPKPVRIENAEILSVSDIAEIAAIEAAKAMHLYEKKPIKDRIVRR